MAPIQKWFARMLPSGATRGLSGDPSALLAVDPRETWYNNRLQCHRAKDDFVENPEKIWECSSEGRGSCGLLTHFASLDADERLGFTHILVIVSQEDVDDADEIYGDHWRGDAEAHLLREIRSYLERTTIRPALAQQLPRVFVVPDGDKDLLSGHRLGLIKGEFVTAMVPNVHQATTDSDSELVVFMSLPDAPGDFREVGRLYSDQLLFTLGNHWLDNHQCQEIPGAALYQVHRDPKGGYLQVINPDGAEQSRIEHGTAHDSADVISIHHKEKGVIARVVLAVADKTIPTPQTRVDTAASLADESLAQLAPVPLAAQNSGAKPSASPTIHGHLTIVPDVMEESYVTLQETGALLQRVHFKNFMTGYNVYLSPSGHLGTIPGPSIATLKVRKNQVYLQVQSEGVLVDDQPTAIGARLKLTGTVRIEAANRRLEYRDLTDVQSSGWPYLAEIRRQGSSVHLNLGSINRIGRGRSCQVRLPDEHHNENIVWRDSDTTSVRARSGNVDRSRFHTDSIMVASEHAELDLHDEPKLRSLARHCFTYLRRKDQILALHPTERDPGPRETIIRDGDEILVGNCVFLVRSQSISEVIREPPPKVAPPPPAKPKPAVPKVPQPASPSIEQNTTPGNCRVVAWVEETSLEKQLAQPIHICHIGWMVGGEHTLGNHMGASLVLPELRMDTQQNIGACDYANFTIKGRRGRIVNLAPKEASLYVNGEEQDETDTLDNIGLEIKRRDGSGEVDFSVSLRLETVEGLPNPRARLLVIDTQDPMVKAMQTQGVSPTRPIALRMGPVQGRCRVSDQKLVIEDYHETRIDNHGNLISFYVSRNGNGFLAIEENGGPISLSNMDRLIVGDALYSVRFNT